MTTEKTIFRLERIDYRDYDCKPKYPEFLVERLRVGHFSTLESAVLAMRDEIEDKRFQRSIFGFLIEEYLLDSRTYWEVKKVRSYLPYGALWDETLVSSIFDDEGEQCEFLGRPADKVNFQEGDLVEVLHGDSVRLEIVMATPPSPEWVSSRKEVSMGKHGECRFRLDESDDSYRVDNTITGHSHPYGVNMFPIRLKVGKRLEMKLNVIPAPVMNKSAELIRRNRQNVPAAWRWRGNNCT